MRIFRNIDQLPAFNRAVITIGTFDGVHTGHQQILEQLKREAARIGGETVIVTFDPHPRKIVNGATREVRLINTLEEKIGLLALNKMDNLVIVPFTEAFSKLSAEQYVKEFLLEKFNPHTIIIGYDHQFGQGRKGDYHLLEAFSKTEGFELHEIPVHVINALSVSSTRIREAIVSADIEATNRLLGYDFFFSGRVVGGNKLGRTLGYPTANLEVENPEKLTPGDGIYVVEAELETAAEMANGAASIESGAKIPDGEPKPRLKGMMSIGVRPTVDGVNRVIEVNLFDFNEDIYGKMLRVYLKKYLRKEEKFDGLEALKVQLAKDKENSLAFFRISP